MRCAAIAAYRTEMVNLQRCLYCRLAFRVRVIMSSDTDEIVNVSVSQGLKLVVVTTISSPSFQSTAVSTVIVFDPLSAVVARWVQVMSRCAPNRSRLPKTAATVSRHIKGILAAVENAAAIGHQTGFNIIRSHKYQPSCICALF